jgi:glycosyltransferase involved in cell wall biosynthesis
VRLLIVTQYFWPENFRVNDLVGALVERGHQVTVLTGEPNYPDGRIFPEYAANPEDFTVFEGAEVVRVPLLPRGRGAARLALNYLSFVVSACVAAPWRLRDREFDVIFVYQPSPITSCLPAILLGRLKAVPVILWTLDLWPETLKVIGIIRSPYLLGAVGVMVSFIYRNCSLVLGGSRAFELSVRRYAGSVTKYRYFPQWSEELFEENGALPEIAPEVRPFIDTFNVLFAGNIGDAQDFPAILEAAVLLRADRRIRWLIVGDGRAADWVRAEIVAKGLEETVVMLGRHPIERMPSFFVVAGALLVSLRRDPVFAMTIPGKVQTYLAAGRPIVGMLDGEGGRVIAESGAGFVAPSGDSVGLAAAVQRLAGMSEAERREMGERGRLYASLEFGRESLLTQLDIFMTQVRDGVEVPHDHV